MNDINITVGIATDGVPVISPAEAPGLTRVENVAIGLGFHWQRNISCEFPGEIHLNPDATSQYSLLNTLPLETYLECVVGSEMNPDAPIEFLRAHAIISRSWVAGKILGSHNENRVSFRPIPSSENAENENSGKPVITLIGWEDTGDHKGFHVCSDDHCQRYQGLQPLSDKAREAIRSTQGLVLATPDGRIVDARFSKCCGGKTEIFSTCWQDKEEECLESFEDPWCDLTDLSAIERDSLLKTVLKDYDLTTEGGYTWQTNVTADAIARYLREKFSISIGEIQAIRPVRRGPSGRIRLLEIEGKDAVLRLGKELFIRRVLAHSHLYSSAFDIEKLNSHPLAFRLKGHGWGHGVGLCQIGAAHMAAAGHSHRDILQFYYPGSRIIAHSKLPCAEKC